MKFFVDTADVGEIVRLSETGLLDGVTTNPSLIAKSGGDFLSVVREICSIVSGPVSAECTAIDYETMLLEARKLSSLSDTVVIKVPLTEAGLRVCKVLSGDGIGVNVTLCFSAGQALLAAKAGASFISPFVGRLDDIGEDGMGLISDICEIYGNYGFVTEVLVASVRHVGHVVEAALIGAHVVTVPPKILWDLYRHELTDIGLEKFLSDWKGTGQSIL